MSQGQLGPPRTISSTSPALSRKRLPLPPPRQSGLMTFHSLAPVSAHRSFARPDLLRALRHRIGGDTVNAHGRQEQRRRSKDSEDHQTEAVLIQGRGENLI